MTTIFLHSGFRTASTWFWNCFRQVAGTHAYYEPFHEVMTMMTPDLIAELRPDARKSGHPSLSASYFTEYSGLLGPDGGVPQFRYRFSYEGYYTAEDDDDQRDYLAALIDHAHHLGKQPVLGFCRSLGRVPWIKRSCPGLHIVTWRDPWDQWASIAEQTARGNSYFDFRFYLVACVGRHSSAHHAFFEGLILPRPCGETPHQRAGYLQNFYRSTPIEMRFRIFLRVFMLDLLLALPEADLGVDMTRMSADASYRTSIAGQLRHMTGLNALSFDDCYLPHHPPVADPCYRAALEEALAVLSDQAPGPATASLRASLEGALRRFADNAAPEQEPPGYDQLTVHLILFAITMVQRHGGHTEEAMAFLQETFGAQFADCRGDLAQTTQFILWQDVPHQPAQEEAAERLYEALTTE